MPKLNEQPIKIKDLGGLQRLAGDFRNEETASWVTVLFFHFVLSILFHFFIMKHDNSSNISKSLLRELPYSGINFLSAHSQFNNILGDHYLNYCISTAGYFKENKYPVLLCLSPPPPPRSTAEQCREVVRYTWPELKASWDSEQFWCSDEGELWTIRSRIGWSALNSTTPLPKFTIQNCITRSLF